MILELEHFPYKSRPPPLMTRSPPHFVNSWRNIGKTRSPPWRVLNFGLMEILFFLVQQNGKLAIPWKRFRFMETTSCFQVSVSSSFLHCVVNGSEGYSTSFAGLIFDHSQPLGSFDHRCSSKTRCGQRIIVVVVHR